MGKDVVKILQSCPYLDGLIVYDQKDKGWWDIFKFSSKVRAYKFDQVIDFQNSRRSHVLAFLSFARDTYGFHNGKWSFLLTRPVSGYRNDIPPVEHQFQILEKLGISYKTAHPFLELWPSEKDRQYAQKLLDAEWLGNSKNMVGINIAASAKWQTKNWPVEHVAKLCDLLSSKNIRVVLTGMAKDKILVKKVLSLTHAKPADLTGKTDILQLAALIKKCKVFVTPDSAPLHVAAAMKVPCIAFFGPTDSKRHIPPAKKMIVFEKKPACAPCYSSRCKIGTHACLQDITPEEVAEAIETLIGEHP
ncbi:MAG: hypothetical protein A2Y04_01225 [Omnitrophica WOR_2 bacterium GWC2_45_7]|nr:MAG: hypothetical protein A2Y04_01225 [Omnitrophica WOR_2 bacterium GWC2_45_7]